MDETDQHLFDPARPEAAFSWLRRAGNYRGTVAIGVSGERSASPLPNALLFQSGKGGELLTALPGDTLSRDEHGRIRVLA